MTQKEPLYRKVNTTARGVHHATGGEARWARGTKAALHDDAKTGTMHGKHQRGLDYTPLYRFLLSKVGHPWDRVHFEAVARLNQEAPIYALVARNELERRDFVRCGRASYYSGLYIDAAGCLAKVAPDLTVDEMEPGCGCCTHTFNGHPFTRAYRAAD